jgi:hypothetical protein
MLSCSISRAIHLRSIKSLQWDDWIMTLFVTTAYTALIVCANRYVKVQSNLLPPGFDISALTDYDRERRRYGSKLVVVVEQTQIATIWACKACLLIMYHRLTRTALRNENIAIKLLAAYVALGFVVMEILYWAVWCRPVTEYWTIPTTNSQCTALINHRITKAVFNLSSDFIMLVIALQMLIRSLLPLKRKLVLCGIFSLGIFVIIASILNSYYSFKNPYRPTWTSWYVRESSTAILVANLPYTWTILRQFYDVGTFDESSPPPWTFHSSRTAQGRRTAQFHSQYAHTTNGTRTHPSPPASKGSQGTHAMTLIDSLGPFRSDHHNVVDTSQTSQTEKEELGEDFHHHDFAFVPSCTADLDLVNIDLEHGAESSPSHSHRPHSRITEDGTGGFYVNNHVIPTPSRAYLNRHSHHVQERSSAESGGRPTSPTPGFITMAGIGGDDDSSAAHAIHTEGTGRSAGDRKARARRSE